MADYSKMYSKLSNAITDVIRVLQKAQQETEEMYISAEKANLVVLERADAENNGEDKI